MDPVTAKTDTRPAPRAPNSAAPVSRREKGLRRWRHWLPPLLSGVLLTLAFPPLAAWPLAWVALIPWYVGLVGPWPDLSLGGLTPCSTGLSPGVGREAALGRRFAASATPFPAGKGEGGLGRTAGAEDGPLRRAWISGFLFGFALFLVGMTWMTEIGSVPWVVLAIIQALPFAVLAALCAALLPRLPPWARPWAFAALWTLAEGLRSWGRYAFPWFLLASSQVRALPLAQVVALTSQWGLSFAIAAGNALLAEAWLHCRMPRSARRFALAAGALIATLTLGGAAALQASRTESGPTKLVAAIQGNYQKSSGGAYTANDTFEMLRIYIELTREAARRQPALAAWPETTVPRLLEDLEMRRLVSSLARETDTPILVGSWEVDNRDRWWNTALLVQRDGTFAGRYDKVRLVPIGEFFPLRGLLGPIYARYDVPEQDFTPGTASGLLTASGGPGGDLTLGALICYESAFPHLAAARVRSGAPFLVMLTSDQTFGTTAGPYQHADLAVLRAIETRRYLLRAASTGISEIIDPWGRIHQRLGLDRRGVLSGPVRLRTDQTLAVRGGDWFLGVCGVVVASALVLAARTPRPKQEPGGAAEN